MGFIRNFSKLSKEDVEIAGGKGASLGEMINSRIPVPEGFVILADSFEKFLEETNLNIEIDVALDKVKIDEIHTIDESSVKINAMILTKEIPKSIANEIEKKFKKLNSKFVAVRSSATSEDSASAAWAGQLDTFLNTTKENLLQNIKKCWASLFTPRAIFYRFEQKLNNQTISVAVVVQKMIDSEKSGIAFSVHPVTQDKNQIIIEAVLGLGEAIVSGQITPDSYVVDKQDWKILDVNVNEQPKGLFRKKSGGNEWKDLKEKGKEQVLNEKEIIDLSKLIVKIENHYGFPVDVEWAEKKGEFFITQSRAITTLSENKEKKDENKLVDKFLNLINKDEIFSCLDITIFSDTIAWTKRDFIKKFYDNKTPFSVIYLMKENKSVQYCPKKKFDEVAEEFLRKHMSGKPILDEITKIHYADLRKINKLYSKYSYEYIKNTDLSKLQKDMPKLLEVIQPKIFCETAKDKCKKFMENLSDKQIDKIWEIGSDPVCENFITRRNKIVYNEILNGKNLKHLSEDLQYFYANLTNVLNLEEVEKALISDYNISVKKAKEKLLLAQLEDKKRKKQFENKYKKLSKQEKHVVDYLQKMIELRDLGKDLDPKGLTIFYRIASIKIFNKLNIPEKYIQFISYNELLKPLSYFEKNKDNIMKREKGYGLIVLDNGSTIPDKVNFEKSKQSLDNYMDKILLEKGEIFKDKLVGISAFKGKVVGRVRIITNINEQIKDFKEGEILFTGMTRPEHIFLIKKAKAIVTNEGGITCHAAIISRELKKPCIVGTKNGTRVFKNGDLVEVDADNGIVKMSKG